MLLISSSGLTTLSHAAESDKQHVGLGFRVEGLGFRVLLAVALDHLSS